MDNRLSLLRKYSAEQFAAWETHLYLDTHPYDLNARTMFEQHNAHANELKTEYESKYGPLKSNNSDACEWLSSPWPWERSNDK